MAAARKSISIVDGVSYVLADHDSDLSDSDLEHSESESSSDEGQQHVVNEVAGPNFRRRIRTRGGINARNALKTFIFVYSLVKEALRKNIVTLSEFFFFLHVRHGMTGLL